MKPLRDATGMTQYELARLLKVSQSVIAQYEKNRRPLPAPAGIDLNRLVQSWRKQKNPVMLPSVSFYSCTERHHGETIAFLEKQLAAAVFRAEVLTRRLERLRQRYRRLTEKYPYVQSWQQLDWDENGEKALKVMENELLKSLEHCNPAKQALTAFQLEMANARAELARQTIHQLKLTTERPVNPGEAKAEDSIRLPASRNTAEKKFRKAGTRWPGEP